MFPVGRAILTTLAYFDQFDRALTVVDIHSLMWDCPAFHESVKNVLQHLIKRKIVFNQAQFYGLSAHSIQSTVKRQALISNWRDRAIDIASIMSKIRGIRAIILMNSLAMQTHRADSDIDLLVIVDPNSLYLSRTISLLNLKVRGLVKSKAHNAGKACLGYWLSADDLTVLQYQKHMHTSAFWVATMVPLFGIEEYKKFIESNNWVYKYLPNWSMHQTSHLRGNNRASGGALSGFLNQKIFPLHRARIFSDPELAHSLELVCEIDRLKLHSIDQRPAYSRKMQSILDIVLTND